jgi:hypothetical protein
MMRGKRWLLLLLGIILVIAIFAVPSLVSSTPDPASLKRIIPLDKLVSGGPPKDGIPSIENPQFVEPSQAEFLSETDLVIGIHFNGVSKAYPLLILVWHELVNDWVDDVPIVVSYCPLCYSSIAFLRTVDSQTLSFGTSGRLYKNDLVMYDRQPGQNNLTALGGDLTNAGNLWSQMLGQAIVGDLAGMHLTQVPIDVMEWRDWTRLHPETQVLSTNTGFARAYGTDPYSGYYRSTGTFFPVENADDRLSTKEIIFGIQIANQFKAYPSAILDERGVVNDVFSNTSLVFLRVGNLAVRAFVSEILGQRLTFASFNGQIRDGETNSTWNKYGQAIQGPLQGEAMTRVAGHKAFWFAWADFHPETEVYLE